MLSESHPVSLAHGYKVIFYPRSNLTKVSLDGESTNSTWIRFVQELFNKTFAQLEQRHPVHIFLIIIFLNSFYKIIEQKLQLQLIKRISKSDVLHLFDGKHDCSEEENVEYSKKFELADLTTFLVIFFWMILIGLLSLVSELALNILSNL